MESTGTPDTDSNAELLQKLDVLQGIVVKEAKELVGKFPEGAQTVLLAIGPISPEYSGFVSHYTGTRATALHWLKQLVELLEGQEAQQQQQALGAGPQKPSLEDPIPELESPELLPETAA